VRSTILLRMFNLGPLEILLVFGVGLVVLGPRRLPEMARYLGKFYGMIRKTTWELRQTLDAELLEEDRRERRDDAEQRREEFRAKRAAKRESEPAPVAPAVGPTVAPEPAPPATPEPAADAPEPVADAPEEPS